MTKLVIFGAGQTGEIAHFYFTHDSEFRVVAFTVDGDHLRQDSFLGLPVVPFESVLESHPARDHAMHVALSYSELNKLRERKYLAAKSKGYRLASYVSSQAGLVGRPEIGDNCLILENQSIQPRVRIGNNVALFGGALIGHHSQIGDHCWVTSEVGLAGNVTVGARCFLGINATVGHFVSIGDDCFLGAGCLVTKDLKAGSVVIARETDIYPLDSERFLKITKLR